jgi:hypothetical protein
MTVEETLKVDFHGLDPKTGAVLMVVSDHLDWDEHEGEHLLILPNEWLNAYKVCELSVAIARARYSKKNLLTRIAERCTREIDTDELRADPG